MSIDVPQSEISINNPEDLDVLTDVISYLDQNYTDPLNQGPIHLTGSSVYGTDPNDYDLSIQRQAEDERDFSGRYADRRIRRQSAVNSDEDDRIIAAMMRDLSDDVAFDEFRDTNTIDRTRALIQRSHQVRPRKIGQPHDPISRYELQIDGADLDLTFTPATPNREYLQLTEDHR